MGHPEQPCRFESIEQAEAGQRPGRQVEAGLDRGGGPLEGVVPASRRQGGKVDLVEGRHRLGRRVFLMPAALSEMEAQAQGVVVLHDGGHGLFQSCWVEGLRRLQQQGLVELVGSAKPARRTSAGSGERHLAHHRPLLGMDGGGGLRGRGVAG